MTQEAAEILTQYGGEIYNNYSGRGMYGEKTTGITFDSQEEFHRAIADVLERADRDECESIADTIRYLKTDSLGKGFIYY